MYFAGGGDVGVAHPGLHVGDRELAHGHRSEAVAQLVEAEPADAGVLLRRPVAPDERVVAEHVADLVDEHELVVIGEVLAPAQTREGKCDLGHQRHGAHPVALGEVLAAFVGEPAFDVEQRAGEVDRAPAQTAQLAGSQAGERRG
jgi:hypothetical protein